MERLTEEKQIGPFAALKDKAEAVPGAFGSYDCLYAHMVAVTRLKEYEDTGLEPRDIDTLKKREQGLAELLVNVSCGCAVSYTRLAELAQAEKDGRLVVLPCKVGDTVFRVITTRDNDPIITGIRIKTLGQAADLIGQIGEKQVFVSWYLTREEAEAALKKEKADNEAD